jgi:hypothetical protein
MGVIRAGGRTPATISPRAAFSSASPGVPNNTPPPQVVSASAIAALVPSSYLHSKSFGATGNGVTDDTAALQSWLDACSGQNLPGWLDPGTYLMSSPLTVASANGIAIFGPEATPGCSAVAQIMLGSLTQDGIQFNTTGRIFLRGFAILSGGTPTAGSALNFQGSANQSIGAFIERLVLGFGTGTGTAFNGITATGLGTATIRECDITAQNICLNIANPGDTEITGNRFNPVASGAVGLEVTGDPGGLRVISNKFTSGTAYHACISIVVGASVADGDIFIIGNSLEGVFANGYGIIIDQAGDATFNNVQIVGNEISCPGSGSWGIYFTNTTLHWLGRVIIASNVVQSYQGIFLGAMDNWVIEGNVVAGTSAIIEIEPNCTNGVIANNILNNVNSITDNSTFGLVHIVDNPGYNPVGVSFPTPGASPWTYTAGASPEHLYLAITTSGGGITLITQNGNQILANAVNAFINITVGLGPNEVLVITYTGSITARKMVH